MPQYMDIVLSILEKIIWAVLCALVGWLVSKYKRAKTKAQEKDNDLQLVKDALRHTLRHVLKTDYEYYQDKGYCTVLEKQEFEKTYKTYHTLGGNGTATHMYEVLLTLPEESFDKDEDE